MFPSITSQEIHFEERLEAKCDKLPVTSRLPPSYKTFTLQKSVPTTLPRSN